jgi:FdhE protein
VETPRADQELLAALRDARENHPELAHTIGLHEEIISARSTVEVSTPDLQVDQQVVSKLLDQRVALLQHWGLEWDPARVAALAAQICDIGARHREELAPQFEEARSLLTNENGGGLVIVAAWVKDGRVDLPDVAVETSELLPFVLIHSLHPFLYAYATLLTPFIQDERWYQRRCPVCYGEPDFGYLEEEVGGLRLLCSRCDTLWTSKRGECAFCGNSENETFAYYLSDDEVYRLYVCDHCERYLKVFDGRQSSLQPLLPLQRIITVGMDVSAREEGYR